MRAVVKKWGNSASVRIPASVLKAANLCLDEPVDVREESGRIVIEPIEADPYELEALLNQMRGQMMQQGNMMQMMSGQIKQSCPGAGDTSKPSAK